MASRGVTWEHYGRLDKPIYLKRSLMTQFVVSRAGPTTNLARRLIEIADDVFPTRPCFALVSWGLAEVSQRTVIHYG